MSQIETGNLPGRPFSGYSVGITGHKSSGYESSDHKSTQYGGDGGGEIGERPLLTAELPPAERIRDLARHAQSESVAYQSVAVAGLQILERVLDAERAAVAASLSLAQRDKLEGMIESLERVGTALRMSLSAQGSKMFSASSQRRLTGRADERSWWFALTEAIQSLEDGIDAVTGIVACQPRGGAARVLSGIIARILHRHHNELLGEAEQWIG